MSDTASDTLHDRHLRLWGIPLSVAGLLFSQMPIFFPGRWDLLWKYIAISVPYTSLIWEASRWLLIRVRRRYPTIEQTRKRVVWMLLSFLLVACIGQAVITVFVMTLKLESPMWVSPLQTWLINVSCSLFFIALIGGVYEAKYFFSQYRDALQKAEYLKKQQAQQRLEALKTRVNPHFLFNSLTTLSALIGEDAPRAEQFVDELSKVYRYLLRAGRQSTATPAEELQFADSYAFLLQNRFADGAFSLKIAEPDTENRKGADAQRDSPKRHLPALALQHGLDFLLRTQNTPLHIRLDFETGDGIRISCKNRPKALSFDAADNDWKHLENSGATQSVEAGVLHIVIPFTETTAMP